MRSGSVATTNVLGNGHQLRGTSPRYRLLGTQRNFYKIFALAAKAVERGWRVAGEYYFRNAGRVGGAEYRPDVMHAADIVEDENARLHAPMLLQRNIKRECAGAGYEEREANGEKQNVCAF